MTSGGNNFNCFPENQHGQIRCSLNSKGKLGTKWLLSEKIWGSTQNTVFDPQVNFRGSFDPPPIWPPRSRTTGMTSTVCMTGTRLRYRPIHVFTVKRIIIGLESATAFKSLCYSARLDCAGHSFLRPAPWQPCSVLILATGCLLCSPSLRKGNWCSRRKARSTPHDKGKGKGTVQQQLLMERTPW